MYKFVRFKNKNNMIEFLKYMNVRPENMEKDHSIHFEKLTIEDSPIVDIEKIQNFCIQNNLRYFMGGADDDYCWYIQTEEGSIGFNWTDNFYYRGGGFSRFKDLFELLNEFRKSRFVYREIYYPSLKDIVESLYNKNENLKKNMYKRIDEDSQLELRYKELDHILSQLSAPTKGDYDVEIDIWDGE